MTSVAICALTLHRPRGLDSLLGASPSSTTRAPNTSVSIVIVDNDPEQSALTTVDAVGAHDAVADGVRGRASAGHPVRSEHGRAHAPVTSDFVAFLDDDEIADPDWLAELLRVQRTTGADVVTGTVLPVSRRSAGVGGRRRFFERQRFPPATV